MNSLREERKRVLLFYELLTRINATQKMKSLQTSIFLLLLFILSCKKEEVCPSWQELGEFELSTLTKTYLPDNYFSKTDSITFESTEGKRTKFYLDRTSLAQYGRVSSNVPCQDDTTRTVSISYKYPYNTYSYLSTDSLRLILINTIGTTNDGYYDLLNIWLSKEGGPLTVYGQINIITDNRTVRNPSIIENPVSFTFYEHIVIGGQLFNDVYGDKNPGWRISNVYWQQHKGLIGYKDKNGIDWLLKE